MFFDDSVLLIQDLVIASLSYEADRYINMSILSLKCVLETIGGEMKMNIECER